MSELDDFVTKTYRCTAGHEWQGMMPWIMRSFTFKGWPDEWCYECLREFMLKNNIGQVCKVPEKQP